MLDIKQINSAQLQDPALFPDVQQAVLAALDNGRASQAKDFVLVLDEFFHVYGELEASQAALFSNYRKLKLFIQLRLFELMPEEIQVRLLTRHLFSFARIHVDVMQKVGLAILLSDPALEDDYKATLTAALLNNQEGINASVTVEDKQVPGTVANWLLKYRAAYGLKPQDSLVRMDFASRGDARTLTEEEREKLIVALNVFEALKVKPEEEQAPAEQAPAETPKRSSSPLYVPRKKSIVPLSEIRRSMAPSQRGGTSVAPATPAAGVEGTFQKLSDIEFVTIPMIEKTGITIPQFVATIKNEVARLATQNPQISLSVSEAWRKSPLYLLYMDMAQESMNTKKPVSEVTREREAMGRLTLSKEDFDAISDLSRSLQ